MLLSPYGCEIITQLGLISTTVCSLELASQKHRRRADQMFVLQGDKFYANY